ncbi:MAG: NAD(P)-dependent oxidoreductase [Lautropia sp.]
MTAPSTLPRVGYAGLGLMGSTMPPRLLSAGYGVTVWNRDRAKCEPSRALGARVADTPAALARSSDVIQLCLTDTAAVAAVVFGPDGIAQGIGKDGGAGKLLVDHSTIPPQATRDLAERLLRETGARWVDAPVSGGANGGRAGTLVVFAGGTEEDVATLQPLMAHLSRRMTRMGDVGAGQAAKSVNQLGASAQFVIIAEMIALARATGVDAARIPAALEGGFGDSRLLQAYGPKMLAEDFAPVGRVSTIAKDLKAIEQAACEQELPLPLTSLVTQLVRLHMQGGHAEEDIATLVKMYQRP